MWYEFRRGRPKPYMARWRLSDNGKDAESFVSAAERSEFAARWVKHREEFGKSARMVDAKTVTMMEEFRNIVGDVHPLTVAREWVAWRGTAEAIEIPAAWKLFNDDQEKRTLSGDSHSHRRLHGFRLVAFLKRTTAASVRAEDIDEWLDGLTLPDTGEAMSSKSKLHHLKTARHFFEWLKDRRKIPHNPCDAVTPPDANEIDPKTNEPIHRDINILTVEQGRALFAANRDALCVGRLAVEAFAGLRYTSAARLKWEDIAWDDRGIVMPGHQHKSTNRHFVDGWPDNLWTWMKHAPRACWDIPKRQYADLKREAFVRAGLKPPEPETDRDWTPAEKARFEATKNVLRHSFVSFHLAAFKDARLTAYLTSKTSVRSLNNDYRGRATQAQGKAWCSIAA